jgi:hypothetical protein
MAVGRAQVQARFDDAALSTRAGTVGRPLAEAVNRSAK